MNKNCPLVSVLMTAFNRDKFIGEAISSVLVSTYTNFELIIVDDCSTDSTLQIAKNFAKSDNRIRVFINDKNLGDYVNRNKAASYANGKYLKYLDSDDLIYPHGLEVFVKFMELSPSIALGLSSTKIQHEKPYPIIVEQNSTLRKHFFENGFLEIGPSGCIIKTEVFNKLGGFSGKRMIGDTELWLKIACEFPVMIVPPSLIYWRQHEGQEFRIGVESNIYLEMYKNMITDIINSPICYLTDFEKNIIIRYYRIIGARGILSLLVKTRNLNRAIFLTRELDLNIRDFFEAIFNFKTTIRDAYKR